MNTPDDPLKLRLASSESTEDLARRLERDRVLQARRHESDLEEVPLAPMRVGSVPYLNAVPLTRGLEDQIVFAPPSRLAELLREEKLDAALVSVTEVLFNDRYDVLDNVAVASLGEVKSVFLAHRKPLEEIDQVFPRSAYERWNRDGILHQGIVHHATSHRNHMHLRVLCAP